MLKSEFEAIKARQREIQDEITRLQQEADELLVALRVLRRFSPSESEPESKLGPPRPEGAPTLFEMTETVIDKAHRGLTGREIVEAIGRDFWPGVQGPQILPSVYGFAKRDRLKKLKGYFFMVKKNEAPNDPPFGASDDEGDTSSSIERDGLRP